MKESTRICRFAVIGTLNALITAITIWVMQAMRSARKLCLQLWTQRTQKRLYFRRPLSPMKNDHSCLHFLSLIHILTEYNPLSFLNEDKIDKNPAVICQSFSFEAIIGGSRYELDAVSYTHLDVYKRQHFRCAAAW